MLFIMLVPGSPVSYLVITVTSSSKLMIYFFAYTGRDRIDEKGDRRPQDKRKGFSAKQVYGVHLHP
jgi:hypothetical protein